MHNLKELNIWKKAIDLTLDIYKVTSNFPGEEKYGLTSQMRRASVSVSSNIAEGAGRNSDKEFLHFLGIANGSSFELQTQVIIAFRLNFFEKETYNLIIEKINEIQKMNRGLQNKLKNDIKQLDIRQ